MCKIPNDIQKKRIKIKIEKIPKDIQKNLLKLTRYVSKLTSFRMTFRKTGRPDLAGT